LRECFIANPFGTIRTYRSRDQQAIDLNTQSESLLGVHWSKSIKKTLHKIFSVLSWSSPVQCIGLILDHDFMQVG